jgi:hypothetical protein
MSIVSNLLKETSKFMIARTTPPSSEDKVADRYSL